MVSHKHYERKNVCLPTQLYDVLSIQVSKRFISNVTEYLDYIRDWNHNGVQAIFFQMVIL